MKFSVDKYSNWGYYFLKRRLPFFITMWYLTSKNISKVKHGYRLVPEAELEKKCVKCLEFLIGRGEKIADYLEFGVFCGSSMACMFRALERLSLHDVRLFGFDSFKGLPAQAKDEGWSPGDYCMSIQYTKRFLSEQGVDMTRTYLIDGWFADTLNDDTKKKYDLRKSCIFMIDCDIYTSSREALEFIFPLLSKVSIVLFDDWFSLDSQGENLGQKKAFSEFLEAHPEFTASPFDSYGKNSKIFLIERQ